MEEVKTSRARVAFVLLCGLAVCCGVMYATADGSDEFAQEIHIGSGQDVFKPRSIESVDVKKAGFFYTRTPDTLKGKEGKEGRERLLDFFNKIEDNIAKETQERKEDITKIRATMMKNMQLNEDARKKMKSSLLKKMAEEAKIAKDNLASAMRKTQATFAEVAHKESLRHKQDIKRFRKTREIMRKNKKEARRNLAAATHAQQKALETLDAATNAKIHQTNSHIAANAAQIKINAKKARDDLDHAMNNFQAKMANTRSKAAAARSRLVAQAAAQDKKFRTWAANKVVETTASEQKKFDSIRSDMAKDRAAADAAVAHESSRLDASLNAAAVLNKKNFAQTVSDIAQAKKEASDRVAKFTSNFNLSILQLKNKATKQVSELTANQGKLAKTVTSNRVQQAEVNHKVEAELKRMVKLGKKRYDEHVAKDAELESLMKSNREDNAKKIKQMSLDFNNRLDELKEQAAKDRKHASDQLAGKTNELFDTLKKNDEAQAAVNKELTDATHAMALQAKEELASTKADFTKRLGDLTGTVENNLKKNNKAVLDLTGVVETDAIKNAEGRRKLRVISDANKDQLKNAITEAVNKGEQQALKIEKAAKVMNDKTAAAMNDRINKEIGSLRDSVHSQLNEIKLESKEARAMMKKQTLQAVQDAANLAKANLKAAVADAEGKLSALNAKLLAEEQKSSGERVALEATIKADKAAALAQIANAVAAQEAALLAQKLETAKDIKATNTKLSAAADEMKANALAVAEQMKTNAASIKASLDKAREAARAQLAAVSQASAERYDAVVKAVEVGISEATTRANNKFAKHTVDMANQRAAVAANLAVATNSLNSEIAKFSALEDVRFSKTVKDLKAARAEAKSAVSQARADMKTGIASAIATLKKSEGEVTNRLQVVSDMLMSDKAAQAIQNKKVKDELARITGISNKYKSDNANARGIIRKLENENKKIAAQATKALSESAHADISKLRSKQARDVLEFKKDLTDSTEKLYKKMGDDELAQNLAMGSLNADLTKSKASTAQALKSARDVFVSRHRSLTNKVTANQEKYEKGMARVTEQTMDWKKASAAGRKNIRATRAVMVNDLENKIARAITIGEARQKRALEVSMANIASEKKALLSTIGEAVENMADNVFATINSNRKKIADNYLSLKAYAATAEDQVTDYLAKGKGRNLSSLGDLLKEVGNYKSVKSKAAKGLGFGGKTIELPFSGKKVPADASVSKVNGLVNEYLQIMTDVKNRHPLGLGKYLISKLEVAMQATGALEVDKISDKAGNFVFINAHAVGLSSKLSDFESLAVRMTHYEKTLSTMTAKLPTTKLAGHKSLVRVSPPQWQGD